MTELLLWTLLAADPITLWHSYRGTEEAALRTVVAGFAQGRDVSVEVLAIPAGAYEQKLRNALHYSGAPDLFVAPHDLIAELWRKGWIESLGPPRAAMLERALNPLDGHGWPLAFKSLALFCRRDLVAAPPTELAELVRVRAPGVTPLLYDTGSFYFHAPWFFGSGARVVDNQGSLAIDVLAAARSGELLRGLLERGVVRSGINGALVTELFHQGQAACVMSGPWFMAEIDPALVYDVAPLPRLGPVIPVPFLTVEGLAVTRGRLRPEVEALLLHVTSDEAAFVRLHVGRQPVANASVYDRPEVRADEPIMAFRRQLELTVPMPTVPLMALAWEPLDQAMQALNRIGRGMTPHEAFSQARARIEAWERSTPPLADPGPYVVVLLFVVMLGLVLLTSRLRRQRAQLIAGRPAYVLLLPTLVGLGLLVGIPLILGVGVGFLTFDGDGNAARFVGFGNFSAILSPEAVGSLSFYVTLGVTLLWTVTNVCLHVAVGLLAAFLLAPGWLPGRALWRALLVLPWAVPSYISALVFRTMFHPQVGSINAFLTWLGQKPIAWFDNFVPAFCANLVTNVWLGFPFMMVTILSALQAIPQDLYDAARLDGASDWQRFRRITLPLLGPMLGPAVVLGTIWTFNMFNVIYLVSEGQPDGATDILVTEAYRWAFLRNGRYGYAAAYSLLIFVILFLYHRLSRRLTARMTEAAQW